MKLAINDLKRGSLVAIDGSPHIVMFAKHSHIGRGGAVVQTKIKNLRTGKVFERSMKPSDNIEEAEIKKLKANFIYERNKEYWFHETDSPSNRFSLEKDVIGEQALFLKPKIEIKAFLFNGEIINIELPIKADYEVTEAPPSIKGNTSQGGNKIVMIEGGSKINVPLFIETGDIIRVNTETFEYSERVKSVR